VLAYLLPIVFVAIFFGVVAAVLTAFASGLVALYVLLPPLFSFYIDDPLDIAELGFMVVLAILAGQHFPPAHLEPH
jgi:K+-sensing histidine kinase KdpD